MRSTPRAYHKHRRYQTPFIKIYSLFNESIESSIEKKKKKNEPRSLVSPLQLIFDGKNNSREKCGRTAYDTLLERILRPARWLSNVSLHARRKPPNSNSGVPTSSQRSTYVSHGIGVSSAFWQRRDTSRQPLLSSRKVAHRRNALGRETVCV